ncbi:MAG: hypothetical protein ACLR4Z_03125 [Butyricicoccaceae bacterium]
MVEAKELFIGGDTPYIIAQRPQGRLECSRVHCQCAAVPADPPGGLLRLPFGSLFTLYPLSRGVSLSAVPSAVPFFYRLLMADLAPIQRRAAGGEIHAQSEHAQWPAPRRPGTPCPRRGKRGQGHRMVPLPPLTSPNLSLPRLSRSRVWKRGNGCSVPCVFQLICS